MSGGETGRCSVCGAQLRAMAITYTQELGGAVYIVSNVPADVCQQCGEQYLAPDTVDVIQDLVQHGGLGAVAEIRHVPVYRFPRAV